jgi:hypothetical protein
MIKSGIAQDDIKYIPSLITYFDRKIGLPVVYDGKSVNLNWDVVKKYLITYLGYDNDELNAIPALTSKLKTAEPSKNPLFESYALTLRKMPDDALYKEYLKNIKDFGNNKKKGRKVTQTEADYIEARKSWTDVVSETYIANQKYTRDHDVKGQVIQRLKGLGLGAINPEQLYEACIAYIRNHSVITITFDPKYLGNGLTDYQPLNVWERGITWHGNGYLSFRDQVEKGILKFLPDKLKNIIFSNKHARPRYGALLLLDRNTSPRATKNYGNSFIVLKDVAKLNTTFSPGNSYKHKDTKGADYKICTIHNLEFLLWQCPANTLRAIIAGVQTGTLQSPGYDQNYFDENNGGYLVAMIPSINIFDPNLVERIHIDSNSYQLSQEDIKAIQGLGINITNTSAIPYTKININTPPNAEFDKAIEQDDAEKVIELLNKHPSLAENPHSIYLAAKYGSIKVIKLLLKGKELPEIMEAIRQAINKEIYYFNQWSWSWTALHKIVRYTPAIFPKLLELAKESPEFIPAIAQVMTMEPLTWNNENNYLMHNTALGEMARLAPDCLPKLLELAKESPEIIKVIVKAMTIQPVYVPTVLNQIAMGVTGLPLPTNN